MSHKEALERLIPVELGGVEDGDLTVEGDQLDLAQADIEALRQVIITDIITLTPPADDRIKLCPVRGDIKKPYLVARAAAIGYTIRIDDYTPSMVGWLCIDDELIDAEWENFSAGLGNAGDTLSQEDVVLPWIWLVVVLGAVEGVTTTLDQLEVLLNDLKPAHILLNFELL